MVQWPKMTIYDDNIVIDDEAAYWLEEILNHGSQQKNGHHCDASNPPVTGMVTSYWGYQLLNTSCWHRNDDSFLLCELAKMIRGDDIVID